MPDENQQPNLRPSKWAYFFIILGALQAVGVAAFLWIMLWAMRLANEGASGTEYIGLAVYVTLVPAVGLMALINLIGLPIYMFKRRQRGKALMFCIISLAFSVVPFVYAAYGAYQFAIVQPSEYTRQEEQFNRDAQADQQKYLADNAKPEITKDEAIALLNICQLNGLYYTNQTDTDKEPGTWAESSSTGVVLTKVEGKPYRISIADRLIPELVPIAREAQKSCNNLQFWHDGSYEQYENGHWYFDGQVVN